MVKVCVAGCAGRMGQRIVHAVERAKGAVLHTGFERKDHPAVGKDIGLMAGLGEKGIKIADTVDAARGCDVLIDFTEPKATAQNVRFCQANGVNMVIGTTGLSEDQKKLIKKAGGKIAVVFAPNMGVGINVLFNVVKQTAGVLGPGYDVEIIEAHHNRKKDAPSGTAFGLAEAAAQGRKQDLKSLAVYGRQGSVGARKEGEIGIHAVRGGDIIGEHTVVFAGPGEKIEISHSVVTRDVFAGGAAKAAEFLSGKKPGLFNMQDVLGLTGR
jgi:4-hydroxy-tetrahydrodipicolinate reductase